MLDSVNEIITDQNVLRQIVIDLTFTIANYMSYAENEISMESNFCKPDSFLIMIEVAKWFVP